MTPFERLKRWGVLGVMAGYPVLMLIIFDAFARNPEWREGLWALKLLSFAGIFVITIIAGYYFLGQMDKQLEERDTNIRELERRERIEAETNEEIIAINQLVNEQVIELTRLSQELDASYEETLQTLAVALDSRDKYTQGHSIRVAEYSVLIAEKVGYSKEDLDRLRRSALLHDIGKIGVEDAVLRKDGKLTPEEWKQMQRHPEFGYEILKNARSLTPCLDGVLYHHERLDGKGYPHGLSGGEIPLDAKIIAIADSYDAMTSDRPYRTGMSVEKAVSILIEVRGTQLEPELVDVFIRGMEERKATPRPPAFV